MIQSVHKQIISGDFKGVSKSNDYFQTRIPSAGFNVADMPIIDVDHLAELLLRNPFFSSVLLNTFAYFDVVVFGKGHLITFLSEWPAAGISILPSGFVHSNGLSGFKMAVSCQREKLTISGFFLSLRQNLEFISAWLVEVRKALPLYNIFRRNDCVFVALSNAEGKVRLRWSQSC